MQQDIFSALQDQQVRFSKGQRAIAAFITENYEKAAFMTASRMGKAVGVSESTVVRFAVELGYDGYPAMQKAMQEMVMNRLTSVQRIEVSTQRLGDQDVLDAVIQSDMEKLRQTAQTVSRQDFASAVEALVSARRVYILGVRSASALASFLGYYLSQMLDDVRIVTTSGTGEMFEKLLGVGAGDVVVAFSFPRYSSAIAKGAGYCRSAGARIIGITDSRQSPLGRESDWVLLAKSDMVSLVDSLTAPLSITNALIVAVAGRREGIIEKNLSALERVWEEYKVYEKQVEP